MDKTVKEQFVKDITKDIIKSMHHSTTGSAYWRMTEILKSEIEEDREHKIFNDDFANGLAQLRKDTQALQRKFLLVTYLSGAYILYFLLGHAIPITLPYINNSAGASISLNGVFEIIFITFLIASNQLGAYGSAVEFYNRLLCTYVDTHYGEKARDLYILRWGIDNLSFHLSAEEYRGYKRVQQQSRLLKFFLRLFSWVLILFILSVLLIVMGATVQIIMHPAFGWLSVLVVCAVVIYFLKNIIGSLSSNFPGTYTKTSAGSNI